MFAKGLDHKRCTLVIIADGFEETEAIVLISLLRQAGLCVKSVGLTSGPIGGAHGVWVMPDLTLADLDQQASAMPINAVILPNGGQNQARLEADPRVHRLLRQVITQKGQIVTSREGFRVLQAAAVWAGEVGECADDDRSPVLVREQGQSLQAFAHDLIRKLNNRSGPGR